MEDLAQLQRNVQHWLAQARDSDDIAALDRLRVQVLGKKGAITQALKGLGALPADVRQAQGKVLNALRAEIVAAITAARVRLDDARLAQELQTEAIDVTRPGRFQPEGTVHPISQVIDEVIAVFARMGFRVAEGPEIEDDYLNFTALNMPPSHPARQMHDTFYVHAKDDDDRPMVLRTHTSPVQVRTMRETPPPLRVIAPGRTYRCDSDVTHTPMFHQVEGIVIDKVTHFGHLKGCLEDFCRMYFETDVPLRFRPSYFPFTEPSAEVDIGCFRNRDAITIGAGDDWLEILGCGMVHPNVMRAGNIDPDVYQGFAFGVGIERLAMLKYGIPDLRTFFASDLRWLRHHGFRALDVPSMEKGLSSRA